jgi:hypothetical protein
MAEQSFVPVIEPVKESLGGLKKALEAICDAKGQAISARLEAVAVDKHVGIFCTARRRR